jgi:hypothetical protein
MEKDVKTQWTRVQGMVRKNVDMTCNYLQYLATQSTLKSQAPLSYSSTDFNKNMYLLAFW